MLPSELSGIVKIRDLDVCFAHVERLRRMRELTSEFSQACARRAAELIERRTGNDY